MYTLAPARPADIAVCYAIIEGARTFQREQGFVQWTDDYPNETTIAEDIRNAVGYLFLADREIAGYLCVDFAGEPAYAQIAGEWHTGTPYAVIHRMAFDARYRGRGLSTVALHLVEALCLARDVHAIRIDTDFHNRRMQHILHKAGYLPCGTILFQGGERQAYDKILRR